MTLIFQKASMEQIYFPLQIYLHLTEFFLSKATKLTISTVCVFPGNWTHNLLRCWRNALPLSHRNTSLLITHPSEHRSSHWDLSSWLWEKCLESQWSSGDPQHRGLKIQARDQTVRPSQVQYTWRCECGLHENQGQRSSCFHWFLELKAQHINNNHVRVNVCVLEQELTVFMCAQTSWRTTRTVSWCGEAEHRGEVLGKLL